MRLKQAIFESLAEIAQALGRGRRLELMEHLGQGERSLKELTAPGGAYFRQRIPAPADFAPRVARRDPACRQAGHLPEDA